MRGNGPWFFFDFYPLSLMHFDSSAFRSACRLFFFLFFNWLRKWFVSWLPLTLFDQYDDFLFHILIFNVDRLLLVNLNFLFRLLYTHIVGPNVSDGGRWCAHVGAKFNLNVILTLQHLPLATAPLATDQWSLTMLEMNNNDNTKSSRRLHTVETT